MEKIKFNCWKCTACCRFTNIIPELKEFDRGDGVCKNLAEDGSCLIYETRPEICNTSKIYEKKYKSRMSWEEYVKLAENACKFLEENMKKNLDQKKEKE